MGGKKARAIRKVVYGDETYRQRAYAFDGSSRNKRSSGTLSAGDKRRVYQTLKRMHREPLASVQDVLKTRHGITVNIGQA